MTQHQKYADGDRVQDLTFDPPIDGVVSHPCSTPDAYHVRLEGSHHDVIIHVRNLRRPA